MIDEAPDDVCAREAVARLERRSTGPDADAEPAREPADADAGPESGEPAPETVEARPDGSDGEG